MIIKNNEMGIVKKAEGYYYYALLTEDLTF